MTEGTGGTRSRIQAIALELFTEQGYEKTSLREIAERLGVTKAALYYHFKCKDDIVDSFLLDRIDRLNQIIDWARQQSTDASARRAVLARYADELFGSKSRPVMHFFEQNQTVLKSLAAGQLMRERMLLLADVLAGPDATPIAQTRAALSLFAVHSSWFTIRTPNVSDAERRQIALTLGYELLDRIGTD